MNIFLKKDRNKGKTRRKCSSVSIVLFKAEHEIRGRKEAQAMALSMLLFAEQYYGACHVATDFYYRLNNNPVNKRRKKSEPRKVGCFCMHLSLEQQFVYKVL